ncbi:hypothetical protein [Catellatospora bangladeshensis]|nr:hypothetical protein [Catellatospora bangladeshensis]
MPCHDLMEPVRAMRSVAKHTTRYAGSSHCSSVGSTYDVPMWAAAAGA